MTDKRKTVESEFASIAPATLEKLRATLAGLVRAGLGGSVTAQGLRKAAQTDMHAAGVVARHFKARTLPPLDEPWAKVAPPVKKGLDGDLVAAIRASKDRESLAALSNELAARLVRGEIDANTARALRDVLAEQRKSLNDSAKYQEAEVTDDLLPVTEEGAAVVRAFEALEEARNRNNVKALIEKLLREERNGRPEAVGARPDEAGPDPG